MTSPNTQKNYTESPSSRSVSRHAIRPKKQKRHATLYDAVAGRVSSTGFLPTEPRISKHRGTVSSSCVAVPPEEVLFRRKGAPERYEEDDIYWADRDLEEGQTLPGSDLLKAIHTYASDFYGRSVETRGVVDFESLDETALLALGILLEEMAGHVLGDTGDLAFVEGEEIDEEEEMEDLDDGQASQDDNNQISDERDEGSTSDMSGKNAEADDSTDGRKRKRRKMKHESHENE